MNIQHNVSIENTFKVRCVADSFVSIHTKEEFLELLQTQERKTASKKLFIGGGSNMLLIHERYE